jgi:ATP-binding cassette, subfamily B, bacterial HlyB/CyaB
VKALALEKQRKALWDGCVADAGKWRLAFGKLSNWPQTFVNPIERFMSVGIVLGGADLALSDPSGYAAGALFAFMMLSMRVAQPLAGLARLIDDYEQVGAAIGEAASVLNRPTERDEESRGLRPRFSGAIAFDDVSFTYPGTKSPALDRISFDAPAGAMLGIVGRSGSGKSTLARLLQGINLGPVPEKILRPRRQREGEGEAARHLGGSAHAFHCQRFDVDRIAPTLVQGAKWQRHGSSPGRSICCRG